MEFKEPMGSSSIRDRPGTPEPFAKVRTEKRKEEEQLDSAKRPFCLKLPLSAPASRHSTPASAAEEPSCLPETQDIDAFARAFKANLAQKEHACVAANQKMALLQQTIESQTQTIAEYETRLGESHEFVRVLVARHDQVEAR